MVKVDPELSLKVAVAPETDRLVTVLVGVAAELSVLFICCLVVSVALLISETTTLCQVGCFG